jgi:hypothetical protein
LGLIFEQRIFRKRIGDEVSPWGKKAHCHNCPKIVQWMKSRSPAVTGLLPDQVRGHPNWVILLF